MRVKINIVNYSLQIVGKYIQSCSIISHKSIEGYLNKMSTYGCRKLDRETPAATVVKIRVPQCKQ